MAELGFELKSDCYQAPISSSCTLPRDQKLGLYQTQFSDGRNTGFNLREVDLQLRPDQLCHSWLCDSNQPSVSSPVKWEKLRATEVTGVLEALGGERLGLESSPSMGLEVGLELGCSPEMGKEGLLQGSRGPLP